MKIKNLILPVLLVIMLAGFIVYKQFFSATPQQIPATAKNDDQTSASNETINPNQNNTTPTPAPTTMQTQTGYKDGQYTGTVANTVYGDIQVKVIITGGKITDIQMLKTPTGGGHTAQLVASSFPILQSEAIAAQSSQVDIVSGATQNSEGFSQSLASALSKAS